MNHTFSETIDTGEELTDMQRRKEARSVCTVRPLGGCTQNVQALCVVNTEMVENHGGGAARGSGG